MQCLRRVLSECDELRLLFRPSHRALPRGHRLRRNLRGERKAREEFLQLHVDEVYDKLTFSGAAPGRWRSISVA